MLVHPAELLDFLLDLPFLRCVVRSRLLVASPLSLHKTNVRDSELLADS